MDRCSHNVSFDTSLSLGLQAHRPWDRKYLLFTSCLGYRFYLCIMLCGTVWAPLWTSVQCFCITFSSMDFRYICQGFWNGFGYSCRLLFSSVPRSRIHLAKPSGWGSLQYIYMLLFFFFHKNMICLLRTALLMVRRRGGGGFPLISRYHSAMIVDELLRRYCLHGGTFWNNCSCFCPMDLLMSCWLYF